MREWQNRKMTTISVSTEEIVISLLWPLLGEILRLLVLMALTILVLRMARMATGSRLRRMVERSIERDE